MIAGTSTIDTEALLKAAGTKLNFLHSRIGVVGGHCIGVYRKHVTHKAEALGCHPQVILAGRRIDNGMGAYVAGQMAKAMLKCRIHVDRARVLVLALTFKENFPDRPAQHLRGGFCGRAKGLRWASRCV